MEYMNRSYGQRTGLSAITTTFIVSSLLLIKVFAWWYTGSVSLLAALVDSFVDIISSLASALIARYSLQPADENHTFGHGKAEPLSALFQSLLVSGSALFLLLTGIQHIVFPIPIDDPGAGVAVSVVVFVNTIALTIIQYWFVKKTKNHSILEDLIDYQTDIITNGAILIALWFTWCGWHRADAIFTLGIGICILCNALRIGYEAVQSLLDRELPDKERKEIYSIVAACPGVNGSHDLRTRQSGSTRFIQIHLEMEDNLPLVQAHLVAEKVKHAILVHFPGSDVIIHQDPCSSIPSYSAICNYVIRCKSSDFGK